MYLRRVATILSQVWRQLFRLSSPAIHFAFSQAFCRRTGTAREIGTDLHSYICRFKRRLSSDPNIHFSHIYISRFLPVIGVCGRSLVILSCKVVFDPHISSFNENIWIPFVNHLPATGNPKGPLTRYFPTSEQELKDMIWIRWGKVSFPGTWVSFCAMIPRYDMSHSGKMYLYLGIIVHFSCTPSHVFSDSQEPATSSMTSTCTNTLVNQLFRSFLLKYFLLKFY